MAIQFNSSTSLVLYYESFGFVCLFKDILCAVYCLNTVRHEIRCKIKAISSKNSHFGWGDRRDKIFFKQSKIA